MRLDQKTQQKLWKSLPVEQQLYFQEAFRSSRLNWNYSLYSRGVCATLSYMFGTINLAGAEDEFVESVLNQYDNPLSLRK